MQTQFTKLLRGALIALAGAAFAAAPANAYDTFTPAFNAESGIVGDFDDFDVAGCYTEAGLQAMQPGDALQIGGSITFGAPPAPGFDAITFLAIPSEGEQNLSLAVDKPTIVAPASGQTTPLTYSLRLGTDVLTHQDYLAYLVSYDYNTVTGQMGPRARGLMEFCANTVPAPPAPAYAATVRPPVKADGSSVFANRGVIPLKFSLTLNGSPACALPGATVRVTRNGTTLDPSAYATPANSGSTFRVGDCQYLYNLDAKKLGAGTYRAEILIDGATVGEARFAIAP